MNLLVQFQIQTDRDKLIKFRNSPFFNLVFFVVTDLMVKQHLGFVTLI
jgi:hypothetical protein